jgi:methionyl-tRNA formyltransferase
MEDAFVGRAQDQSKATVWPARTPEDGMIDQEGPVADAERLVRAVTRPYPGAYAIVRGRKIKVWKAEVLDDRLRSADGLVLQFSDGSLLCTDIEDLGPA